MNPAGFTTRTARSDDAAAIQEIYAPIVETTAVSFEDVPPSVSEMAARIALTLQDYPFLVGEHQGQVVGYAYGGPLRRRAAYRWSVEVAAYVAEEVRGLGIGRMLYGELLPALAAGGYHAAFAGVALPNPASIALHKALGFQPVGTYYQVGFTRSLGFEEEDLLTEKARKIWLYWKANMSDRDDWLPHPGQVDDPDVSWWQRLL